jgi:hypothetical protein
MMSALECYMKAALYLKDARASDNDVARALLLETAKTWRNLAERAKSAEAAGGALSRDDISPDLDIGDPPVLLPGRS